MSLLKFSKIVSELNVVKIFITVTALFVYFGGEFVHAGRYAFENPCVRPVNETILPKCTIAFLELGATSQGDAVNGTCLDYNVFVIHPKRANPPSVNRTSKEYLHFKAIYGDDLPLQAWMHCESNFPLDFEFDGVGAIESSRIWKAWSQTNDGWMMNHDVLVVLTPEATGRYTFYSIRNPNNRVSFFLSSERGRRPYMVGGSRIIPGIKVNHTSTLIPCIASDQIANVTLYKKNYRSWALVKSNDGNKKISYDSQRGFILNASGESIAGVYRCFADDGLGNKLNNDYITVQVNSNGGEQSLLGQTKPQILKITIKNKTAWCSSKENRTDLKFHNVCAGNPAELRLFEQCFRRQYPNCGNNPVHGREEGRTRRPGSAECPNNSPTCLVITDPYPFGLLYCETSDGEYSISQEYFTGLDSKIYTNISQTPSTALIKMTLTPNRTTSLFTSTAYEVKCESVDLYFVEFSEIFWAKYKNGSVSKLGRRGWARRVAYLTTDMDEIYCTNQLWTTLEMVSSQVLKANVTALTGPCDQSTQFECKNSECILRDFVCDGISECTDESEELNCTVRQRCQYGHFKCNNGECISEGSKCDGIKNCMDGWDESTELCLKPDPQTMSSLGIFEIILIILGVAVVLGLFGVLAWYLMVRK